MIREIMARKQERWSALADVTPVYVAIYLIEAELENFIATKCVCLASKVASDLLQYR